MMRKQNSAYKYVGKDDITGYDTYIVPVKEKKHIRKTTNLDDNLFDDDDDFCDYYKDCELDMEPLKKIDSNNLTLNDFFDMDIREIYFHLYQLLKSISSSLSDNVEVDNNALEF